MFRQAVFDGVSSKDFAASLWTFAQRGPVGQAGVNREDTFAWDL
jgi:hypothetical protein